MIILFQMTGTPLLGYKRLQFNMFLKKESKITVMKTLNEEEKLVPLFWVEEVSRLIKIIIVHVTKSVIIKTNNFYINTLVHKYTSYFIILNI